MRHFAFARQTTDELMASWNDIGTWDRLRSGEACPICLAGQPDGTIAELSGCYVATSEGQVRGYCALFAKRHVVELHDLSDDESVALRDLRSLSRIIHGITGAIKINCEIRGNTIPHLHVHLIPRYRGDELEEPGKTLGNLSHTAYEPGQFEEFSRRLRKELAILASEQTRAK
jgi:diadenosine tetraphosphate (Ap4A) HIT family hydrolase